jgi:hypothetical protein
MWHIFEAAGHSTSPVFGQADSVAACRKAMVARENLAGQHVWNNGEIVGRMLKNANLLTRPTPADISPTRPESTKTDSLPRDAPFRRQGRSKQRTIALQACSLSSTEDGPDEFPTARNFSTRPPAGTPRRAISPGEGSPRPRVARAQGTHRTISLPAGGIFQHPAIRRSLRA